jgi:phosphate transport system permease protein
MASVPVQVSTYVIAPYDDWHHQAWAGALVLVLLVAVFSVAVGVATGNRHGSVAG